MGTLITVYGKTDGTNTTGIFTLQSEAFTNTPTYIKADKGMKIKIWARRVSGSNATIYVDYIPNVMTPSTYITIDAINYNGSVLELEKRKPIIIHCRTGKEGVQFRWKQSSSGETHIVFDIEFD